MNYTQANVATSGESRVVEDKVSKIDSQKYRTFLLRQSQFVTWPLLFVFFKTLFKITINRKENLEAIKSPFIIIANHPNVAASFLFRLVLGFNTPHLPLRFMAVRKFVWRWLNFLSAIGFVDFIYGLFGVFTVVPGRGIEKNLAEAKRIIYSGGNVVIYPEGTIESKNVIAPFHSGASVLAKETGSTVLPVSFRIGNEESFRKSIVVNIGSPIRITKDMSIQQITNLFYASVGELFGSEK